MYKCKHFKIQELVPPKVYKVRGEKAWELLDERGLVTLDALRDHYGTCIVNNWANGGKRKWSGLRTHESSYYSPYSQHSFGRAFDCIFPNTTAENIRKEILADRTLFPFISGLELGTSWLHFDCRNTDKIKVFTA